MSSLRRIQSSRLNGARSRGPVTPEGKQRSAQNSLRHGILARHITLEGECKQWFTDLIAGLTEEFQPKTTAQQILVQSMAVARWRQMRIWTFEKLEYNREIARQDPNTAPAIKGATAFRNLSNQGRSLDLAIRYENTYERQFLRCLNKLLDLQAMHPDPEDDNEPACECSGGTWEEAPAPPLHTIPPNEPNPENEHLAEVAEAPENMDTNQHPPAG